MSEVGKEYLLLFNGISRTVTELETTIYKLRSLQTQAEEAYIADAEDACSGRHTAGLDCEAF